MQNFGQTLRSVQGWVWFLTTLVPATFTFLAGHLEGLSWSQIIPLVTAALAAGAVLAFFGLRGYEIVSGWYGMKKEGVRLAGEFQDLLGVGQKEILISHAATMWAGREANAYQKLVCLRRLKQAADLGLVAYSNPVNGRASKDSMASLQDLATFFRDRTWMTLPPVPPQLPARMKSVERTRRSNWVKGWRP